MARTSKNNSDSGCLLVFGIGVIILMAWLALYYLVNEPGILSVFLFLFVFGLIALGIVSYCNRTKATRRKYTVDLSEIDSMEGHDFEYWCAELLRRNGFNNVTVTRGSGDDGIDIIAFCNGAKYGIQCKRSYSKIGNKAIQEAYTGKTVYGCHFAAVITNNYFTTSAVNTANKTGVLLWNRYWIVSRITENQKKAR